MKMRKTKVMANTMVMVDIENNKGSDNEGSGEDEENKDNCEDGENEESDQDESKG